MTYFFSHQPPHLHSHMPLLPHLIVISQVFGLIDIHGFHHYSCFHHSRNTVSNWAAQCTVNACTSLLCYVPSILPHLALCAGAWPGELTSTFVPMFFSPHSKELPPSLIYSMFSVPLLSPFCALFTGTVNPLSLWLNLIRNIKKSSLVILLHHLSPFLQTFLPAPLLSRSPWFWVLSHSCRNSLPFFSGYPPCLLDPMSSF